MSEAEDAFALLCSAWRVNRRNLVGFERRLEQLADIGRDLRNGRCSPAEALDRAEALGFVAALETADA
jgi:hypothetical protein